VPADDQPADDRPAGIGISPQSASRTGIHRMDPVRRGDDKNVAAVCDLRQLAHLPHESTNLPKRLRENVLC